MPYFLIFVSFEYDDRAETLEWWRKYKSFLKSRIRIGSCNEQEQDLTNIGEANKEEIAQPQEYDVKELISKLGCPLNLFVALSYVLLFWAVHSLYQRVLILENLVEVLRLKVERIDTDISES